MCRTLGADLCEAIWVLSPFDRRVERALGELSLQPFPLAPRIPTLQIYRCLQATAILLYMHQTNTAPVYVMLKQSWMRLFRRACSGLAKDSSAWDTLFRGVPFTIFWSEQKDIRIATRSKEVSPEQLKPHFCQKICFVSWLGSSQRVSHLRPSSASANADFSQKMR